MGKNLLIGAGIFAISAAVTLGVRTGIKILVEKRKEKECAEFEGAE